MLGRMSEISNLSSLFSQLFNCFRGMWRKLFYSSPEIFHIENTPTHAWHIRFQPQTATGETVNARISGRSDLVAENSMFTISSSYIETSTFALQPEVIHPPETLAQDSQVVSNNPLSATPGTLFNTPQNRNNLNSSEIAALLALNEDLRFLNAVTRRPF